MHQTSNFSCKRSFTSAHEQAHRVQPESSFVCHTLLAHGQVSLKGYSFHQPLPPAPPPATNGVTDCWPPSGGRQPVVLKRFTWAHAKKHGAGGQLMYVISSVSLLRSHSDSLTTLSRSWRKFAVLIG